MNQNENNLINKAIETAGTKNKYQYCLLFIVLMMWINVDLISISFPFLQKMPEVEYYNTTTHTKVETQLNYTICEANISYTKTKVYGHSWISELGIECDRFKNSMIGMLIFFGSLIGALIFPFLSDNFGRKLTISISLVGYSMMLIIVTLFHDFYSLVILTFIGMFFASIASFTSYMCLAEITSNELRSIFGGVVLCGFNICGIVYTLVFKYTNSWRWVFIISSAVTFLSSVIFYLYALESPKFYILKNKFDDYITCLQKLSFKNNTEDQFNEFYNEEKSKLKDNFNKVAQDKAITNTRSVNNQNEEETTDLVKTVTENKEIIDNKEPSENINNVQKKKYSALDLLKYPSQRNNFIILCCFWFFTSANYYGITLNLKNLKGDLYVIAIIIYIVDTFAYGLSGIFSNHVGRKLNLLISLAVATVSFGLISFGNLSNTFVLFFSFLARFCISTNFNIIYTYSLEMYPTSVRSHGFGVNTLFARIGTLVAPPVIEYLMEYVNEFFTFVNAFNIILVLFLPETLGVTLKDTIPEEEDERNAEGVTEKLINNTKDGCCNAF